MIPKIIHYCWFGQREYSDKVKHCIESWKNVLPEYEIQCWNEQNFDVDICDFTREAYQAKKYAFVSDYARLYVLQKYGGIYLDVDVEVIKSFDNILNEKMIIALEESGDVTGAFIAAEAGHPFLEEMRSVYHDMKFVLPDGSYNMVVNNIWMQEKLKKYGYRKQNKNQILANDIIVYPDEYFHAKSIVSGKLRITKNTYCIHHHTLLWVSNKTKIIRFIRMHILVPILGENRYQRLVNVIRRKRK